jgi:hypothetical protein
VYCYTPTCMKGCGCSCCIRLDKCWSITKQQTRSTCMQLQEPAALQLD